MDPIGLMHSFIRIVFFPLILPLKLVQSVFTSWKTLEEKSTTLNRKFSYLYDVAREFGWEPIFWRMLPTGTVEKLHVRNFMSSIAEAADFLGTANQEIRRRAKFPAQASLDAADRRLSTAVRLGTVTLMNHYLEYRGTWKPESNWEPEVNPSNTRPVDPNSTNELERFSLVMALELVDAMVRAAGNDESVTKQIVARVNKLLDQRPVRGSPITPTLMETPSHSRVPRWVRWVLLLPAAFAAFGGARGLVLLLAALLPPDSLIKLLWTLLPGSFGSGYVFVAVGSAVAPSNKFGVALLFTVLTALSSGAALVLELTLPEEGVVSGIRLIDFSLGMVGAGLACVAVSKHPSGSPMLPLLLTMFLYGSLTDVVPAAIVGWIAELAYAVGWWPVGAILRLVALIFAGRFALRCWSTLKLMTL